MTYEMNGVIHLDVNEMREVVENPSDTKRIIDVREVEEYVEGHIPGIPLIPMYEIPNVVDQLDPQEEYVFVCRSGNRSLQAALYLQGLGFEHVLNFAGGMLAWDGEVKGGPEKIVIPELDPGQLKRN